MKKNHVTLKESDKSYITDLLSKGKLSARIYKRCTALLLLDKHKSLAEVARTLDIRNDTVADWRNLYNTEGLQSVIKDKARSGRPIKIDGKQKAKITALACSAPPSGYSQWSLRLLADKIVELDICEKISYRSVGYILKKTS